MKITLLTYGSRGDVQPYIALGLGLKAAGHQVRIATARLYESFVKGYGLDFAPLAGNPQATLSSPDWIDFAEHGRHRLFHVRQGAQILLGDVLEDHLQDSWQACQGTDAIISMPLVPSGFHIAEKLGVPFFPAWTCPFTPTPAFPHGHLTVQAPFPFTGMVNRLSHHLAAKEFQSVIGAPIHRWRTQTLKLPAIPTRNIHHLPTLYGYSPSLLPKPQDWGDWLHVTGYWFLDDSLNWQPSQALLDFLDSGSAPVYIGFGSLPESDPARTSQLIVDAVQQAGQRAIVETGWGSLGDIDLPPQIFKMQPQDAPHRWLFPRMAGLIHHGGMGTLSSGLRAGKPTTVIYAPITDYYLWGSRIAELNIGTAPLPKKGLAAEQLAQAIRTLVTDTALQSRAAAFGEKMRAENGVANAVRAFHHHLPSGLLADSTPQALQNRIYAGEPL
ncbi:MAG: glycosyltransferase [Oculatellaceae cyanobacterium Prado106]|nr:glycosyltransferase [Oculatellaceae cyanobacterium Prado106]